jgi:hypothetical protein
MAEESEFGRVVADLRDLVAGPNVSHQLARVARERLTAIEASRAYLDNRAHRLAFVGQIGIGKSSMIAVLSDLFVGDAPPSSKSQMRQESVLAVGSGGTTVCEVEIRPPAEGDAQDWGIVIEPMTVEEMRREISLFGEDEWARRAGAKSRKGSASDGEPTPREVQRAIRHMTGLAKQSETIRVDGKPKKRVLDPIDDLVSTCDSSGALIQHLLGRANLLDRTETSWWWDNDPEVLFRLKERFDALNHGRNPTAMLPRRITIVKPSPLPGFGESFDLSLVDTRGFDGRLAGRPDVQGLLADDRTLMVVCAPFNAAPGELIRDLLRDVQGDVELRSSESRTLLVLMDLADAEGVNEADGDRDLGQALKREECERNLHANELSDMADLERISAFDTLQDDRAGMLGLLRKRLNAMREAVTDRLSLQLTDATTFLNNLEDQRIALATQEVDRRLRIALQSNAPAGTPLRDPLKGLLDAIRDWRYASQVYASCRRNGRYDNMDAYAAVRSGAAAAATMWLKKPYDAMRATFNALAHDPEFADVADHIRLRDSQFKANHIEVVRSYANNVKGEVVKALFSDDRVWGECSSEWGQGSGFKRRVMGHQEDWSRAQAALKAQDSLTSLCLLPPELVETDDDA